MQIFIFDQKFCPRGGAALRPKFKKVNRQTFLKFYALSIGEDRMSLSITVLEILHVVVYRGGAGMSPPISNQRTQLAWRAPYNIHRGEISTKGICDSVRGGDHHTCRKNRWTDQPEIFFVCSWGSKLTFVQGRICDFDLCELLSIFFEKF